MSHKKGGQTSTIQGIPNDYTYNGKELNTDFNLDWLDYGARWYDASIARWSAVDPLAEIPENISWSPYTYVWNNPIHNVDPDGRSGESTIVEENDDGTYTVIGGDANDGDNGIYVNDGDGGKGEKIGESLTSHSFFTRVSDGFLFFDSYEAEIGTVIDLDSREGQTFIDNLISENPKLAHYLPNAVGGEKYDFKTNGIENRREDESRTQYMYRGSVLDGGLVASARDVGNFGAGYIAGENGIPWIAARVAFDALESYQTSAPTREQEGTILAQKKGYQKGLYFYKERYMKSLEKLGF